MTVPKTSRPFRERFLDGFDRSELQREVQRVKPKRGLSGFRKRAASWGLGATLALGGLGIPLKMGHGATGKTAPQPEPSAADTSTGIANDLSTANEIANQVATGVQGAVSTVADTAQAAPAAVAVAPAAMADAARAATDVTGSAVETAKEAFFAREVPFGQIIYSEAKKNDLPPELVAAVAHTESKFVPTARSNRGAVGLMQLVPKTARWLGARGSLTDPTQNIMAGAKYLKYLTDRFDGNTQKAIAAYNAGEGNVRRFGGVPPFRETRNYVKKVAGFQQDLAQQFQGAVADTE